MEKSTMKRGRKTGEYSQRTNEIRYDIKNKNVGESYSDVARKHGVTRQHISFILQRELQRA